ncbi:FKBP-type peptidyl-prolyl cis-trans isomerase [Streptomyces bauhiniae]|uniref:FKBP-type peptidyl-prolyl cis-trans isomerase n=1 Tax=Streptomyces bauhiniae TaxID=2340725 RepID=UPI0033B65FB8
MESETGLRIRDAKVCGGPAVEPGSVVSLLYRVALSAEDLEAGHCLESNYSPDVPITVALEPDQLLPGVYQALLGMRSGGSVRQVHIPSELAFGDRGTLGVPPRSDLWVEICVTHVGQSEPDVDRTSVTVPDSGGGG